MEFVFICEEPPPDEDVAEVQKIANGCMKDMVRYMKQEGMVVGRTFHSKAFIELDSGNFYKLKIGIVIREEGPEILRVQVDQVGEQEYWQGVYKEASDPDKESGWLKIDKNV